MAEATSVLSILVKVKDDAAGALSRLSSEVSDAGGNMKFLSQQAGIAAGAIAAIGAVTFGMAIKQAQEAAITWEKVKFVLKDTGIAYDEVKKRAEAMAETSTFEAHEIGLIYARNLSLFGDTADAIDKTKLAMNLAAMSGRDLGEVQKMVSKASDENIMALRRLASELGVTIPEMDEHANKTEQFAIVLGIVAAKAKGFDETLLGMSGLTQLRKEWNQTLELIGGIVLPMLNALLTKYIVPVIKGIREWAEAHPDLFKAIVVFAGALTVLAAILAPILLMLPTLVTSFTILAAVIGAIGAPVLAIAAAIAGVGLALYQLKKNWKDVWETIEITFRPIADRINKVIDAIRKNIDAVKGFFSSATEAGKSVVGNIKGALGFAEGGIITRPTLGLLGEAGAEAVIPLSRGGVAGLGGITINLQGDFYTDTETAERFANQIARIIKNQLNLAIRA